MDYEQEAIAAINRGGNSGFSAIAYAILALNQTSRADTAILVAKEFLESPTSENFTRMAAAVAHLDAL